MTTFNLFLLNRKVVGTYILKKFLKFIYKYSKIHMTSLVHSPLSTEKKNQTSITLSLYSTRGTFSNHSHCLASLIYFFRYLVPGFILLVVVFIFKFGYSFLFQRNNLSILFMQLKWKYDLIFIHIQDV